MAGFASLAPSMPPPGAPRRPLPQMPAQQGGRPLMPTAQPPQPMPAQPGGFASITPSPVPRRGAMGEGTMQERSRQALGPSAAAPSPMAQQLGAQGRMGDNIVAHINPQEAAVLAARGGSATINPRTGLPEFANWWDTGVSNTEATDSAAFAARGTEVAPPPPPDAGGSGLDGLYAQVREGGMARDVARDLVASNGTDVLDTESAKTGDDWRASLGWTDADYARRAGYGIPSLHHRPSY